MLLLLGVALMVAAPDVVVSPSGPYRTIAAGVAAARPGDRVIVRAGTYRETAIVVDKPLTLVGDDWPVVDGGGAGTILVITADDVTVRGFTLTGTGISHREDRAAVRVRGAARCRIEGNRFRDNLFGVVLERTDGCVIRANEFAAVPRAETSSGNGVHLWQARHVVVEDNRIHGHRDGIYFEFARRATARRNHVSGSRRYGLHFMFSDTCSYEANTFTDNGAGIAVMYARAVTMTGNTFARSHGSAAYGLLLKEIFDSAVHGNTFRENSIGIQLEGSSRITVTANVFARNGWAAKVPAGATDNRFSGNTFVANAFDVVTNSRQATSDFAGNWWDTYRGYDLDGDGVGDVPHHPVRLFALLVEAAPAALVLLRSPLSGMLDGAERLLPVLTPQHLADARPLMRPPAR